jgi:hypothetical protein
MRVGSPTHKKTGAIDDDVLPALAQRFKKREIRKCVTASAAFYPHVGRSDAKARKQQDERTKKASHRCKSGFAALKVNATTAAE